MTLVITIASVEGKWVATTDSTPNKQLLLNKSLH